jgi:hypothetical protein
MPATTQALVIAILVLAPGYIFTQVARRVIAYIEEPTDGRFFLAIITMGTVIHSLMFPWSTRIYAYYRANTLIDNAREVYGWAAATIFILPLLLGIFLGWLSTVWWIDRLLDKIGFGYIDRTPSAWDHAVKEKRGKYVRVHLKGGKGKLGGVYSIKSLGSINARRPDLFLEEAWLLDEDGNFIEPIPNSSGVWIAHDIMGYVEFLEGLDQPYEAIEEESEENHGEEIRDDTEQDRQQHLDQIVEQGNANDGRQGCAAV